MLMKAANHVDYHRIDPDHAAIHERLQNWRRWVAGKSLAWASHPMWKNLKAKEEFLARERGEYHIAPDLQDAHAIEKAVSMLPEKHRFAIRWWYVYSGNPLKAARQAAVSNARLAELVKEGRQMLINRTRSCSSDKNVITSVHR